MCRTRSTRYRPRVRNKQNKRIRVLFGRANFKYKVFIANFKLQNRESFIGDKPRDEVKKYSRQIKDPLLAILQFAINVARA